MLELEKVAQLFQVAIHFHPRHPQLTTLTDNFNALVQLLLTKLDHYFYVSIDASVI